MDINNMENDTICAISTPSGVGGIAVVRVSGKDAITIADKIWKGKSLESVDSHTVHLGNIVDNSSEDEPIDQAVATVYKSPNSFTGEDVVEFSVHGSKWIQRELINLLIRKGCRLAEPGEFTRRAFASGKMDLAQAEAVADVIASSTRSAHRLASLQMRGVFSERISSLRDELIKIASLLELELDFSEEEVEFASRHELLELANGLITTIGNLAASFSTGNAMKEGVPVAIVGEPNVGKSTLLNLLLNDNRAIVSDIPGTTRDTIEDTVEIDDVLYRFIDTAGIRDTTDHIENLGIERTIDTVKKARVVLWVVTPELSEKQFVTLSSDLMSHARKDTAFVVVVNKMDNLSPTQKSETKERFRRMVNKLQKRTSHCEKIKSEPDENILRAGEGDEETVSTTYSPKEENIEHQKMEQTLISETGGENHIRNANNEIILLTFISAIGGDNVAEMKNLLGKLSGAEELSESSLVVTNARHYEALVNAEKSLNRVIQGIKTGISGDFIAQDLRETIHHLGTITGTITTADLLQSIFSNFCIGK